MFLKYRRENVYCVNEISELKEEGLYNAGQIERYVKETGKDQLLIYPGPPVQGFKGKFKSQYEYRDMFLFN